MIITLGFTGSDRGAGYISFSEGYRHGARQHLVTSASAGQAGSGSACTPIRRGMSSVLGQLWSCARTWACGTNGAG